MRIILLSIFLSCFYLSGSCDLAGDSSKLVIAGGSLTEIVYDLNEEKKLIAVDITSNYPSEAKNLPSIGYVRALSTEGLLSLSPSLILGEDDMGPPLVLDQLDLVGVDIRIIPEDHSVGGIINKVNCVSKILGTDSDKKRNLKRKLDKNINLLKKSQDKIISKEASVMLILNLQGTSPIVAGVSTSGDGFIKLLGARNAMGDFEGWKPVSTESILEKNPDFIIVTKRGMSSFADEEAFGQHPSLRLTNAAREKKILAIDGMSMLGFGPRTIETAVTVSEKLLN
tara:strand:+ start:239 stop:1087 length:849 start_codon:yes stop_codon:yes gene_type:complete